MNRTTTRLAALGAAGLLALTGCGGDADAGSGGDAEQIELVGFSILEAANEPLIEAFEKTPDGKGVTFKTSYGASGDQSRAVEGGLGADTVHFSLEGDVTRLVDAGLVAEEPRGTERVYRLQDEGLRSVEAYLRRLWGESAARFRLVVENTEPKRR